MEYIPCPKVEEFARLTMRDLKQCKPRTAEGTLRCEMLEYFVKVFRMESGLSDKEYEEFIERDL